MIFNKDTKNKIEDLNLHDAEVTKVICDYNKQRVEIPVKLSSCNDALLVFEGVQYTDISFYEPWGAGIYVNEINVNDGTDIINRLNEYQTNNDCFCLRILLNSGDEIHVLASRMIYSEN